LVIFYRAGVDKRHKGIRLTQHQLEQFGVSRRASYHGLQALERAGLINVDRHRGRSPRVDILERDEPE
jgi:hypothetical protein